MRQKKAEKEQGIARLVRVKHAVLVIQVRTNPGGWSPWRLRSSGRVHACADQLSCCPAACLAGMPEQARKQGPGHDGPEGKGGLDEGAAGPHATAAVLPAVATATPSGACRGLSAVL